LLVVVSACWWRHRLAIDGAGLLVVVAGLWLAVPVWC
jgi:hypothetical protein